MSTSGFFKRINSVIRNSKTDNTKRMFNGANATVPGANATGVGANATSVDAHATGVGADATSVGAHATGVGADAPRRIVVLYLPKKTLHFLR